MLTADLSPAAELVSLSHVYPAHGEPPKGRLSPGCVVVTCSKPVRRRLPSPPSREAPTVKTLGEVGRGCGLWSSVVIGDLGPWSFEAWGAGARVFWGPGARVFWGPWVCGLWGHGTVEFGCLALWVFGGQGYGEGADG